MWFQTECAGAFQRKGLYGEALKKCHEVERVSFFHMYLFVFPGKYCNLGLKGFFVLFTKGGLISEGFSVWLQSPKKCAKITNLSIFSSGG